MTIERRRDHRYMLDRPVKMQCDQTGLRYLPGHTINISAGGAMIEVDCAQHLQMGQEIRVAVANVAHQAMFDQGDFLTGTIIRSLGCNDTQHVAIRFDKPNYIAQAG